MLVAGLEMPCRSGLPGCLGSGDGRAGTPPVTSERPLSTTADGPSKSILKEETRFGPGSDWTCKALVSFSGRWSEDVTHIYILYPGSPVDYQKNGLSR